ncbi:MAG: SDR family oxidoreductase, partial [Bacteroidetes bacterium]|nr:SDR family oxidoreductase [Bacteroidota bacterium]
GLTSVEKCENNPDLAFRVNVGFSKLIAYATKQLGIKMVHISTDHLFDGNKSMLTEEEPSRAINVYGQTKSLAENTVLQHNPDALVIRTNFYGWGTSYRKSFSDHIIQSLRKHQKLFLFNDVYYTPILAENLIQTVHDLLDKKAKGTFHVVSDDRISKYDFGVLIAEKFGLDKSLIQKSTLKSNMNLVQRPGDMSLSNKKVRDLLGRSLGTVAQHVEQLWCQETDSKTKEIRLL